MLQVELNTIASSFGCLSTQVCKMHRYIVERAGQPNLDVSNLPANDVTSQIADAIGSAVHAYGCDGAAVLFIVQPDEKNSYDQQVHHVTYRCLSSQTLPNKVCLYVKALFRKAGWAAGGLSLHGVAPTSV